MTAMAIALMKCWAFIPRPVRPGQIERARREMAVALAIKHRRAVRALLEAGATVRDLPLADVELAVRELGARRTSKRRGERLVLPGMRGWEQAGSRKPSSITSDPNRTCQRCGSPKPADQSCGCFDNHCQ